MADSSIPDDEAAASRAALDRFAAIIDSSEDAIVSKSLDGTLLSWNPAAERLFGYSAAEVIGRSIMMLIPPDRIEEERQIRGRLQRGQRIEHLRTRRLHKNGHLIDVELTISPLRDAGGRIIGASKFARDIGARLEQERLLRDSEELYRSVVNASGAIVFRADPNGHLATPQPTWEAYTGQAYEDYAGVGWLQAVHPDDREHVAADVARALASGTRFDTSGRLWHAASATYRWIEARSLPLRDDGGAVREWIGSCTDIHERKLAEENSARLARELQLLTDALPALVSYVDAQQRYQFNNRAYENWFGEPASALRGRHLRDVLGEAAFARIRPHMECALQGRRVCFEEELPYVKGSRFVRADYVPDGRPDGTVAGFFALIYDVTESKRAEQALRESEARYRVVVDSQAEMLCRFRPDGTILFANSSYARALGTTADALKKSNFWDYVGEEDRPAVRDMLESLSPASPERQIENRLLTASGVRWTLWTNRGLVFDEAGRVVEAQSSGIDITDRKRVEQQLQDEVRTTQTLNRLSRVIAEVLDLDRLVQAVNDEATRIVEAEFGAFFYNRTDQRGETYRLFTVSGVDRSTFERFPMPRNTEVFAPTFRGEGVVRSDDITLDPRFGRNQPYRGLPPGHLSVRSYLAVPVVLRSGEVIGGLFFGHSQPGRFSDRHVQIISGVAGHLSVAIESVQLLEQARRQAQQLREADRRKDEFLALLSHELRNPLAPMRTCLDILLSGDLAQDIVRRTVQVMDRQTRHLTRLVDDLLEVTRFTRGLIELRRATVDLRSVVRESIEICKPLLDGRGHVLEVDVPDQPLLLDGDQTRLTQVVANLLNNAAKYTPPGGLIRLTLSADGPEAVLQVVDNGAGIPADMLVHIFELFARIDSSLERTSEGLGIGLSLADRLVQLHGGSIKATSEGLGRGATFTVRLPLQ